MAMKIKERISLVGVGVMGSAILEGALKNKIFEASQISVYDKIGEKASAFAQKYGVYQAASNQDAVKRADILLLAVKPQDLSAFAAETGVVSSRIVISILAGTPLAKIKQAVGEKASLVRAMPNLAAKVGEAVTALTGANPGVLKLAETLFSGCGKTVCLDEKHFDLVTAVSGSGPAYFFYLMELLMQVSQEEGLTREQAKLLAVQTAVGAGLLAQNAAEDPEALRKMVTSKGGTTEAALKLLGERKMDEIFKAAVRCARDRGKELSR